MIEEEQEGGAGKTYSAATRNASRSPNGRRCADLLGLGS